VVLPTASGRTVVRGGIGLFYDKIPLNIGAFEQYQKQIVTSFAADGVTVADGPRLIRNIGPGDLKGLRNPYSVAGNVQLDHQVTEHLLFRIGYEERRTHRDFIIEPGAIPPGTAGQTGTLSLLNTGRSL